MYYKRVATVCLKLLNLYDIADARMSTEQCWNGTDRGKQNLGEKVVPVPLRPPPSPHELAWDRIRLSETSEGPLMTNYRAVLKTSSNYFQIQH